MRKVTVLLPVVLSAVVVAASAFVPAAVNLFPARGERGVAQAPGARCTRMKYAVTKKKRPPLSAAGFGARCPRLSYGPRAKGAMLPNTPPNIGLSGWYANTDDVQLKTVALDREDENLLYTYSVTGGKIAVDGAQATWSLKDAAAGEYYVTVEVDDGCGCVASESHSIRKQ